ncbi:MAG: hypothetical protein N2316_10630 [Spirochaetes bacterium]|nr:hypothetical protein [Spirochaetota bacterium]
MNRIPIAIACALLSCLGIFIPFRICFATECNAYRWEITASQKIYDRAVEAGILPANALCSAEYLACMRDSRRKAAEILKKAVEGENSEARIWAQIWEYIAARSLSKDEMRAMVYVRCAKFIPLHWHLNSLNFNTRNQCRVELCSEGFPIPLFRFAKVKHAQRNAQGYDNYCSNRVNLIDYSLECAQYDAFRLYLYIESITDADGHCASEKINIYALFCSPHSFCCVPHLCACFLLITPPFQRPSSNKRHIVTRTIQNTNFIAPISRQGGFA